MIITKVSVDGYAICICCPCDYTDINRVMMSCVDIHYVIRTGLDVDHVIITVADVHHV